MKKKSTKTQNLTQSDKKNYVIDTSVLLYDKDSIKAFVGNNVFIPMEVLDELDRFKATSGILGESARHVIRFLDEIRKCENSNLSKGIYNKELDINYTIIIHNKDFFEKHKKSIDHSIADNRIITAALQIAQECGANNVVIVSKDINLRVKSDALGIEAQDYLKDNIDNEKFESEDSVWSGKVKIQLEDENYEILENLFLNKEIEIQDNNLFPNCLVEISCGPKSAICRANQDCSKLFILPDKIEGTAIKPNDKQQAFAIASILDKKIPLVSISGAPGSGKTYLALLLGIEQVMNKNYERIIITRSMQAVGKEIGFLPGDIDEKMHPWLGPIFDNFRQSKISFDKMKEIGKLEIVPLSYIRGRSFPNAYIIVDEAQNTTIHELKTIVTRAGMNSKMVLIGDIEQIDTPYINKNNNGLAVVIDKFKNSKLSAHIHLNKGVRSELANEANKLL